MALAPFPIDPALTAIAIAYKNPDYIADMVMPRVAVDKQKFTFLQYAVDTFFNVPDTRVGRRSQPNEVTLDAVEVADFCEDYGLRGGVPNADIDNSDSRHDPLGVETMFLQEQIALDRERRVAAIIHAQASYDAGLRVALAGNDKFTDYVNSDPIGVINSALEAPLARPNQMVFNSYGWSKFRAHPKIVEAVKGTGAKAGNASREAVAELFEIDEVIVGKARANSNKRGQAAAIVPLFGKHIALIHKAPVPEAKGAVTFGASFQFGDRIAGQWEDKNMGLRGGIAVQTGESLRERIVANQAGYLIENAFA